MTEIDRIVAALSTVRMPAMPEEYDIHAGVAEALDAAGLAYVHEYRLAPRCRIDFLAGRVGIEVKKGRPSQRALEKQLRRYLVSSDLDAAVVVVQRAVSLPATLCGKPVFIVSLDRLWGVALP
ncbi:MAG: hypothetical protein IJJ45_01075 [Clostridia bacterium]|nr:hypothetical protein [Clostridia bacterium]